MKKKIIIPVLTILSISLILVGTSYAYWRFTYISDKTNIGKSKCLSIELTNQKNEISLNNTYPISDLEAKKLTPYSFTINNTCDTFISYDVNLEMLEGTTMNSKYMAVMINNEHKELLSNLDNANTVMSSSVESRKLVSGSLGVGDSVDYTLRLWMDESVTLSDDAMNKNFTSKIVVTAQPSNYSPKEAGYDTLHDAILANEYQTTPEAAMKKVEAKSAPDFSKTAPIIEWKENKEDYVTKEVIKLDEESIHSDDYTSSLTEKDTLITLYQTKKFDSGTGYYFLEDGATVNPTNINFEEQHLYYINEFVSFRQDTQKFRSVTYNNDAIIYEVVSATSKKEIVTLENKDYSAVIYTLNCIKLNKIDILSDKSDKGLYNALDDYGTSYYYRGNVVNNNVYFGGFYWKIIRINGDGSIRMIYNGKNNNENDYYGKFIDSSAYNDYGNSKWYSGYMYGTNINSDSAGVLNEVNSVIKEKVDNWYEINFENTKYKNYINDTGFCNERSVNGNNFISIEKNIPSFKCSNSANDLFTTQQSLIGNKALKYPVGLITYDELWSSGEKIGVVNNKGYLYNKFSYYTMTPAIYYPGDNAVAIYSYIGDINSIGTVYPYSVFGVRPVINLKSDVKISGGIGTVNDPYVVDTNN